MAEQEDQKIKISYDNIDVVLTTSNIEQMLEAARQPAIQDKKGDDLVKALLHTRGVSCKAETFYGGKIDSILYLNDGKLNDGPNGEPAVQSFSGKGKLIVAHHYKEGSFTRGLSEMQCEQLMSAGTAEAPSIPPARSAPSAHRPKGQK